SKGVVDLPSSKTTNGRSFIFPYSFFCSLDSGLARGGVAFISGEGERIAGAGEDSFVRGDGAGEGEESRRNASIFSRASGGKSVFFKSDSSSARSFAPILLGSIWISLAP